MLRTQMPLKVKSPPRDGEHWFLIRMTSQELAQGSALTEPTSITQMQSIQIDTTNTLQDGIVIINVWLVQWHEIGQEMLHTWWYINSGPIPTTRHWHILNSTLSTMATTLSERTAMATHTTHYRPHHNFTIWLNALLCFRQWTRISVLTMVDSILVQPPLKLWLQRICWQVTSGRLNSIS